MIKNWLDGTPFDYANWRAGQPNVATDQIYARLFGVEDPAKYGTWDSVADFSYNYYPVCMIDAISGPINPPPPDATVPSHDLSKLNCEPNWHYDIAKDACFYIDEHDRSFDAAEANCVGMGGHLASINSPWEQDGVVYLMGLFPSAAGKFGTGFSFKLPLNMA